MENSYFTTKQIKIAVIAGLIFIVCLVAFLVYRSITFRLVGTDPKIDSVATVSPFFKVNFNKTLAKDISVSVSPTDISYTYKVEGSSVKILFSDTLSEEQSYRIKIANISNTKGDVLPDQRFSFTPKVISASKLSEEQKKDINQVQQNYKDKVLSDPLVKLLPFKGGGNEFQVSYTVNYVNQQPNLVIVISSGTDKGKQDALTWIRQVGFDPTDYSISYVSTLTGD